MSMDQARPRFCGFLAACQYPECGCTDVPPPITNTAELLAAIWRAAGDDQRTPNPVLTYEDFLSYEAKLKGNLP